MKTPSSRPRFLRRTFPLLVALALIGIPAGKLRAGEVTLSSPGLASSRMDAQGRLVEDWGMVGIKVSGQGTETAELKVQAIKLDGVIPAAECKFHAGSIGVTLTAYRAPAWPAGLDVLSVALQESERREAEAQVSVELPETVRIGSRTVTIGGRTVLALPAQGQGLLAAREWGWCDDAVSLPGWARPSVPCDDAFKNIRAGMGGVPILYRFNVEAKTAQTVVLGFCESHWAEAGQRPLVCHVEGAAPQEIDPVAAWGQHKPGALQFAARDQNGDGQLQIAVVTKPGAPDENPILNAIWVFPAKPKIELSQVIDGKLNASARYYIDVGGSNDQSLYAGNKLDYTVKLAPGATHELVFLVACPGGAIGSPERTAWTPAKLREITATVWREWAEK